MARYFLSKKAIEDLSGIWNYHLETWSEDQADKYYNMLIAVCQQLSDEQEKLPGENNSIGIILK